MLSELYITTKWRLIIHASEWAGVLFSQMAARHGHLTNCHLIVSNSRTNNNNHDSGWVLSALIQ